MKPCPFCGTEPSVETNGTFWFVICKYCNGGCGASGGLRPSKKQAVISWDRRTA